MFTDTLLKRSLIHDVEVYPNFFSDIFKVPNKNKLLIYILWEKEIPEKIYDEIRARLPDYKISFRNSREVSDYLLKYKPWLIGYNSFHFDDVLIKAIVHNHNRPDLLDILYKMTEWSINKKGSNYYYSRYKYNKSLQGIDLMRVSGLDRIFKPLKQAAANLRHEKIQDLPIKPGSIIKESDIADIVVYELNDVLITEKLLVGIPETHKSPTIPSTAHNGLLGAIDFRDDIGRHFNIDLLNFNKSQIGEKLASKLYSEASNRDPKEFKSQQTNREIIDYIDIIFDVIEFKTDYLKKFLYDLKRMSYKPEGNKFHKKDFKIDFQLFGLDIVFAQGGLHAVHVDQKIFEQTTDIQLIDIDAGSFYPMLYWKYNIEPKHLPNFNKFVGDIISLRMKYKKEGNKIFANGLKLAINRIFGNK